MYMNTWITHAQEDFNSMEIDDYVTVRVGMLKRQEESCPADQIKTFIIITYYHQFLNNSLYNLIKNTFFSFNYNLFQ